MQLKQPYAPLLSLLGFGNGGPVIIPAAIAREAGAEMLKPENYIGTGPYKFTPGDSNSYTLTAYEGYYEGGGKGTPAIGPASSANWCARNRRTSSMRLIPRAPMSAENS